MVSRLARVLGSRLGRRNGRREPRFSILMPTHDRDDVVGAAIESVLGQTLGDWELLVAGDGCTDRTAEVVTGFRDPRIRWFDFPKAAGFGYANRNRALREARGDLVAFLAHDDLLLPDHLETMSASFEHPNCHWAYSRPLWIDDRGRVFPFFVNLRTRSARRDFLQVRNTIPASPVVHRRSCFDLVGMWPEEVEREGDWTLWKRMIFATGPGNIGVVRRPTTLHFRANWRDPSHWGPAPLPHLIEQADTQDLWDPRLTLAPAEGDPRPLQWQVLARFRAPDLIGRLRNGVEDLGDEMAWTAGLGRLAVPSLTRPRARPSARR